MRPLPPSLTPAAMRVAVAFVALIGLLPPPPAQSQSTGAIAGTIVASETGEPLPYSIVSIPALQRDLFADDSGFFRFTGLPPGELVLRVRRVGYSPQEVTFPVRIGVTDTVRIQLVRIALRLSAVSVTALPPCERPGPPDGNRDSVLAATYGQMRLNAQQFETLSEQHPFTYQVESTAWAILENDIRMDIGSRVERFWSVQRWRYKPGAVISKWRDARGRSVQQFNIPVLRDFADSAFVANHCFHNGGIVAGDAGPLVRIDVVAAQAMKTPDVDGAIFLDPETYQIRRTELRLSKLPRDARGLTEMEVVTVFQEILPSIPMIMHVWSVQHFDPKKVGGGLRSSHEEQALAAFDFLGARPGQEKKP